MLLRTIIKQNPKSPQQNLYKVQVIIQNYSACEESGKCDHSQEKGEPIDASPEMTYVLKFSDKDFKTAIITIEHNEVEENMFLIDVIKKIKEIENH